MKEKNEVEDPSKEKTVTPPLITVEVTIDELVVLAASRASAGI